MYNNNNYNNNNNSSLVCHMKKFTGQTVTIFTTSGGVSGCGFTGVLLVVGPCFVRLMNRQGTAPASPISEIVCGDRGGSNGGCGGHDMMPMPYPVHNVGSVCDIPIDKIASFCHNAI